MARYRSNYRRGYGGNYGQAAALRHLEEARAFSAEIGGNDQDVKRYFFDLPSNELDRILDEYGRQYGSPAKAYARKTFYDWKTGRRGMSGLVAKRLFSLLPPHMPISKKYELAENVWTHFGPASKHYYSVGPTADVGTLATIVAEKLEGNVTKYNIPDHVKNRFKWLSAGDVSVEEQLLNHFRQQQKGLALQKIREEIPVLQRQMLMHGDKTGAARSELHIHKHIIAISIDKKMEDGIQEVFPVSATFQGGYKWIWFIIIPLILWFLFHK